ncbi:Cysteine protease family c01a [Globisporangium polare]
MKTFFALAALAFAQTVLSTFAEDVALPASVDVNLLRSEFLLWKASPAGQDAYKNGYVPLSSAIVSARKLVDAAADVPTDEELKRFLDAKATIERLRVKQPKAQFSLETPFALLTEEEFVEHVKRNHYQDFRSSMEDMIAAQGNATFRALKAVTESTPVTRGLEASATAIVDVDWDAKGCVTPVKNKGKCGVSTVFASVGALESGYCAVKGTLNRLSEQDVVSCRTGAGVCEGSSNTEVYDWITRLNGGALTTEATYPYASSSGVSPSCRRYEDESFKPTFVQMGAKLYGGGVFSKHEDLEAVVRKQPVAVGVHASNPLFQYYAGGVLLGDQEVCMAGREDLSVLIVGFGTLDGVSYWKVKNQDGATWGDKGYIYIERGYQGHEYGACGIESYGHYPIFVDDSNAAVSKRCGGGRYGVELRGNVISTTAGVRKAEHCCDACRQVGECVAYTWNWPSRSCKLFSSIVGENGGAESSYSASVLSKAEDAKKCGVITNNIDYPGNDLFAAAAATAEECCDMCNRVPACNAFTWSKWLNGMCYLKSKQPDVLPSPGQPLPDGSSYLRSSTSYKCQPLQTNVDYGGADLRSVQTPVRENCCGICRATDYCAAFTWTNYNGGTCWLKKTGYSVASSVGAFSALV